MTTPNTDIPAQPVPFPIGATFAAVSMVAFVAIVYLVAWTRGHDAAELGYFGTVAADGEAIIVKAWRDPDVGLVVERWNPSADKQLRDGILAELQGAYDLGRSSCSVETATGPCGPDSLKAAGGAVRCINTTAGAITLTLSPGSVMQWNFTSSAVAGADLRPAEGRFDWKRLELHLDDPATYQWKALTPATPEAYTIEPPR